MFKPKEICSKKKRVSLYDTCACTKDWLIEVHETFTCSKCSGSIFTVVLYCYNRIAKVNSIMVTQAQISIGPLFFTGTISSSKFDFRCSGSDLRRRNLPKSNKSKHFNYFSMLTLKSNRFVAYISDSVKADSPELRNKRTFKDMSLLFQCVLVSNFSSFSTCWRSDKIQTCISIQCQGLITYIIQYKNMLKHPSTVCCYNCLTALM